MKINITEAEVFTSRVTISLLFILIFMPAIVVLTVLMFIDGFSADKLIMILLFVLGYVLLLMFMRKIVYNENRWIELKEESIYINDIENPFLHEREICVKDILEIEYYRISSIKAWFLTVALFDGRNKPSPRISTITLRGSHSTYKLGYFTYDRIREIANKYNIRLIVY